MLYMCVLFYCGFVVEVYSRLKEGVYIEKKNICLDYKKSNYCTRSFFIDIPIVLLFTNWWDT